MKSTISGYPRIGKNRELKFAIESYWKGGMSEQELNAAASSLRSENVQVQLAAKLSSIPCSDFSFYDAMLDTAWLLGCVPQRYRALNLSPLDTYFAMARGYQGSAGDVKALSMRKWFNTNYHYLVPELDAGTKIALNSSMFFEKTEEAIRAVRASGSKNGECVRFSVIGPFTFLQLAQYSPECTKDDFSVDVCAAYCALVEECCTRGLYLFQFDEPALAADLTAEDIARFESLYTRILACTGAQKRSGKSVSVLLQTYFGDIRDCWNEVCALGFDSIGLDFVEGKENLALVQSGALKAELVAGVVNGKNIWKCCYAKALSVLDALRAHVPSVTVASSCPLLHVPYTVKAETQLSADVVSRLAFAEEKLAEIADLARLADLAPEERAKDDAYRANTALFDAVNDSPSDESSAVAQKIQSLSAQDFERPMKREERQKKQRAALGLPLLPTTTIGSFPQTAEVKHNRSLFKKGLITRDEYETNIKRFIKDCIALQEDIGLDVLVHGEFERNDMVEYFGENLSGFVFTQKGWVQSYGTRCVKPPIIAGDISRAGAFTVPYIAYAASLSAKPVKGMLTGPVTILNWSFPREDIPLKTSAFQIALAIRGEVLDLEKAGIRIIQIDEAALREKLPLRRADWQSEYLSWAIDAFRLCHSGVQNETQIHTHMCYSEFEDIIADIDRMDADVITFEASRSNLHILDILKNVGFETESGPGVYDIHSPRVPSVKEISGVVEKMLSYVPCEKLWINPDCGLKTRGEIETVQSLRNMVSAAKHVRAQKGL